MQASNSLLKAVIRRSAVGVMCLMLLGGQAGCGKGVTPEQQSAMTKFQDLGGRVNLKRGGYEVVLINTAVRDSDLAQLKDIANLKNVDLQGTAVTDEGIQHLHGIETLEFVYLQRTGCTREGVEALKKSLPKAEVQH